MSNLTQFNPEDYSQLIEKWLRLEQEGTQFPVAFDLAWKIAGYARKDHGKRKLLSRSSYLKENRDYVLRKGEWASSGRSGDLILLTCDAFKHFCLMAETEQGEQVRQYFIEAEKRWKLTREHFPGAAVSVEAIAQSERLKELELLARIAEAEKATTENKRYLLDKADAIATLHGPVMLALIQGRPEAVVEKVEKVTETVICKDGRNVSFEGKSTAQVAKELGFKTGRQLEDWLDSIGESGIICEGMRAIASPYIPTENLARLRRLWTTRKDTRDRQLLLGE